MMAILIAAALAGVAVPKWISGDTQAAKGAWEAMKRDLAYIGTKADADGLYAFGLGDWCAPTGELSVTPDDPRSDLRVTDSAYVHSFFRQGAFWARRFGETALASPGVSRMANPSTPAAFRRASTLRIELGRRMI